MFRHGVRSWVSNFPNEPLSPSIWDKFGGFGQLTNYGVKQMTEFGNFFKTYYQNKFSFEANKIYVKSTPYNRTIQSAKAFLNGLLGENSVSINSNPFLSDNVNFLEKINLIFVKNIFLN